MVCDGNLSGASRSLERARQFDGQHAQQRRFPAASRGENRHRRWLPFVIQQQFDLPHEFVASTKCGWVDVGTQRFASAKRIRKLACRESLRFLKHVIGDGRGRFQRRKVLGGLFRAIPQNQCAE
jgi:hypothetical protein